MQFSYSYKQKQNVMVFMLYNYWQLVIYMGCIVNL